MKNKKKCPVCGEYLKESQYASDINSPPEDNFACRNYPLCPRAEKEISDKTQLNHERSGNQSGIY